MRRTFHMLDGTTRISEAWTTRHFYRRTVLKKHPTRTWQLSLDALDKGAGE